MRVYWLLAALVLCAVLATVHQWALVGYRYWVYPWLDVPVHLLGGLALGTFLVGFIVRRKPRAYLIALALALIAWETFEYLNGVPREANFIFDTALDVLMGALGGVIAYVVARFTLWR